MSAGIGGSPTPAPPGRRYHILDALRGFALFGILVVNLEGLSLSWAFSPEQLAELPGAAWGRSAAVLRGFFLEGKFYSIFSLLFGLGFALQLVRAQQRGDHSLRLFKRRLLVLLAIGLVHLCVIWDGDILVLYALTGFLLVAFRRADHHTLLRWAVVLLLAPIMGQSVRLATGGATDLSARVVAAATAIDQRVTGEADPAWDQLAARGGWREFAMVKVTGPLWRLAELLRQSRLPKVLAMFLVGLWVGRRIRLDDLASHTPFLRRVALYGLWLGLVGNLAMVWLSTFGESYQTSLGGVAHAAAYAVGVAPMALAYVAGFVLLYLLPRWQQRLDVLAPVGRMALTNYLLQSVCGIVLFYGIGFELGGRVATVWFLPIALVIFAAQVAGSRWWLRRFRYGPMEWVWRSLTHGRAQPMRLTS